MIGETTASWQRNCNASIWIIPVHHSSTCTFVAVEQRACVLVKTTMSVLYNKCTKLARLRTLKTATKQYFSTINNTTHGTNTTTTQQPRQILSGIQPTGTLHLGNYLCAIKQWCTEQNNYQQQSVNNIQCTVRKPVYSIVDLHALTVKHNPQQLRQYCVHLTATLLACGLSIEHSTLFIQSHVRAHSELQWLLCCHTPYTWLNKMTQYKDKAKKLKSLSSTDSITLGLYSYPILQTSDILLYNTTHVPVGDDQLQHIELTRDIAQMFDKQYKQYNNNNDIFTIPTALLSNSIHNRVMSLKDGTQKMSKSDTSDNSRINLTDTDDQIANKIKRAKTDSIEGLLTYDIVHRPEISNLLNIYALLTNQSVHDIVLDTSINKSKESFKRALIDQLINTIAPIRTKIQQYKSDIPYIESVWKTGAQHANEIAEQTVCRVKRVIGLPAPIL